MIPTVLLSSITLWDLLTSMIGCEITNSINNTWSYYSHSNTNQKSSSKKYTHLYHYNFSKVNLTAVRVADQTLQISGSPESGPNFSNYLQILYYTRIHNMYFFRTSTLPLPTRAKSRSFHSSVRSDFVLDFSLSWLMAAQSMTRGTRAIAVMLSALL